MFSRVNGDLDIPVPDLWQIWAITAEQIDNIYTNIGLQVCFSVLGKRATASGCQNDIQSSIST